MRIFLYFVFKRALLNKIHNNLYITYNDTKGVVMKERNRKKVESELFTDREEFRSIFWQTLQKLDESKNGFERIAYYGMGGVGKTWLLRQLEREVKELKSNNNTNEFVDHKFKKEYETVLFDLETSTNIVNIIGSLRRKLYQVNKELSFLMTDFALKRLSDYDNINYGDFFGKDDSNNEKILWNILDLSSLIVHIPGIKAIDTISKLYDYIKNTKGAWDNIKKIGSKLGGSYDDLRMKDKLKEIYNIQSPEDLIKSLPDYFWEDMNNSARNYSIVFFIDTFEKLTSGDNDTENRTADILLNDIATDMDNTMWVFAGRDAIFDDPEEKFLIGDLSYNDTQKYLIKALDLNIDKEYDNKLIEKIYEVTQGTPIFLELCVETYTKKKIELEEFDNLTKNKLTDRYIKYQDNEGKRLLEIMSAISYWNDDDFEYVFNKVHNNNFSLYRPKYNDLIDSRMIEKLEENRKFLHRAVRLAIYSFKEFDKKNKQNTIDAILELYKERIEEDNSGIFYYKERVIEFINNRIESKDTLTYEQTLKLCDVIDRIIRKIFWRGDRSDTIDFIDVLENYLDCIRDSEEKTSLIRIKLLLGSLYKEISNRMLEWITIEKAYIQAKEIYEEDSSIILEILDKLALSYSDLGHYDRALEPYNQVYKLRKEKLGEDHPSTLTSMNNLAITYYRLEQYDKALELFNRVYELHKVELGEYHTRTLVSLNNLASTYSNLGQYDKALELFNHIYELNKEEFGEYHPSTIVSLNNLASTYSNLGQYDKELELLNQVNKLRKGKLGEDNPHTLKSLHRISHRNKDLAEKIKEIETKAKELQSKKS